MVADLEGPSPHKVTPSRTDVTLYPQFNFIGKFHVWLVAYPTINHLLCSVQVLVLSPVSFSAKFQQLSMPPFSCSPQLYSNVPATFLPRVQGGDTSWPSPTTVLVLVTYPWACGETVSNVEGGCLIAGRVDFKSCSGFKKCPWNCPPHASQSAFPKVAEGQV